MQAKKIENQKDIICALLTKDNIPSEVYSPLKRKKSDLTFYFDTESSAIEYYRIMEALFDCIQGHENDIKNARQIIVIDPS